ncbi:hypothetical protein [Vibrio vulnificus]|uniref:hypothetical protein n=1 Tax=Vibrio vulnificus TaxID=672 RepID=UPI003ED8C29B
MVNEAADNLIHIMEEKLKEMRISLLKIQDEKTLVDLINDIKPQILSLLIEFDGVAEEKLERMRMLKSEYLTLISLYEN